MKFNFIFHLLFLSFACTYAQTDSLIQWDKDYKLKVDDFKERKIDSTLSIETAELCCVFQYDKFIECKANNRMFFSVITNNNKNQSWIYIELANESILKHEQVHFDICEISARKIRKELLKQYKELDYVTYEMYYEIINKEIDVLNSYQKQYDFETAHGVIEDKQKDWDVKIEKELSELEIYSFENYKTALCNLGK